MQTKLCSMKSECFTFWLISIKSNCKWNSESRPPIAFKSIAFWLNLYHLKFELKNDRFMFMFTFFDKSQEKNNNDSNWNILNTEFTFSFELTNMHKCWLVWCIVLNSKNCRSTKGSSFNFDNINQDNHVIYIRTYDAFTLFNKYARNKKRLILDECISKMKANEMKTDRQN